MYTDRPHSYTQLDSLRGIASLQVMNQHVLIMSQVMFLDIAGFKNSTVATEKALFVVHYSPLHLWYMAYEAVLFFFVLSGFVLYSSLQKTIDHRTYAQYVIKRFFRLYVPFAAAILLSMLCRQWFHRGQDLSRLSDWLKTMWNHAVTLPEYFNLLIFKSRDFHNVVTSLWSIELEIKISILIPLFVLLLNLFKKYKAIDVTFSVFIFVFSLFFFHRAKDFFSSAGDVVYNEYVVRYTFAFVAGMTLCKYLPFFKRGVYNLGRPAVFLLLAIATFLYSVDWVSWMLPPHMRLISIYGFHTEAMILAGCLFIIISFNRHVSSFLNNKYLLHLGSISFSLYLIHPIVILVVTYLFAGSVPLPAMWLIIYAVALPLAHISFKYFEQPVNNFGRRLAASVKKSSRKAEMNVGAM